MMKEMNPHHDDITSALPADLDALPRLHGFRLRGIQMTRLETFIDAAFAFAISMLVIAAQQIPDNIVALLGRSSPSGWRSLGRRGRSSAGRDGVKQVSGRELAQIVQRRGWILARIQGSHHVFTMAGRRERIVIPIHGNQPLKKGLLRSLTRTSKKAKFLLADLRRDRRYKASSIEPRNSLPRPLRISSLALACRF
jgi:predicted RNA binding protein YcfA (HicA-like mRNA interferase family)